MQMSCRLRPISSSHSSPTSAKHVSSASLGRQPWSCPPCTHMEHKSTPLYAPHDLSKQELHKLRCLWPDVGLQDILDPPACCQQCTERLPRLLQQPFQSYSKIALLLSAHAACTAQLHPFLEHNKAADICTSSLSTTELLSQIRCQAPTSRPHLHAQHSNHGSQAEAQCLSATSTLSCALFATSTLSCAPSATNNPLLCPISHMQPLSCPPVSYKHLLPCLEHLSCSKHTTSLCLCLWCRLRHLRPPACLHTHLDTSPLPLCVYSHCAERQQAAVCCGHHGAHAGCKQQRRGKGLARPVLGNEPQQGPKG